MGWVLAGIAAVLVLVGLSRVRLLVSYDGAFRFDVRFWFFRLRLPGQPGAKKVKPGKEKPAKDKAAFKPDPSFFLEHFSELFDLAKKLVAATGRRLVVDRLYLDLRIHEDDAASTAIRYGQACALVYTATGFLGSALRVRRHDIRVAPLFEEGEASAAFSAALSIRVFSVLTLAVTQGAAVIRMMLSFLRSAKGTTMQKDGAVS
ncbi:DUF2953 domain-containing protein [Ethanoligenens harbinense]|uniref:DUF2953 domain-containing protein n=1 Tax=Ethanoligenens harbinense (strain DSM 18485 / JCM 12961 / CGMCC 1.5033 / YUAN-3) TaxID=663278 RepID=E6U3P1_ETHHY|nr:DUF2953 domain-containing protein [Ethanoligenens harbinense]ADU27641.1 hypothetical protein Ethha_2124 [Ethanoligenens harbinense YUAN-3]AVQ96677.1 DUF2953 domain-containing protein [Ethanoligenens harbinense YUAN-3]AYF39337.1 DUF2953 domain-containing protein [Ethanoligenens harbinense]AYF42162.1 DUF2953 domain-containing protein [Ethanoligenens harbinense]QCN92917.1 DUF2953 domain-containing protein [Ethanoligenens harbinense]